MADPMALLVADAAARAVEFVGLPEAQLNLAQAVVHLATAPKSNRVALGIWQAREDVRDGAGGEVPAHLRDAHYRAAKALGHGEGYEYPHDDPAGLGRPAVPPDEVAGRGTTSRRPTGPSERGGCAGRTGGTLTSDARRGAAELSAGRRGSGGASAVAGVAMTQPCSWCRRSSCVTRVALRPLALACGPRRGAAPRCAALAVACGPPRGRHAAPSAELDRVDEAASDGGRVGSADRSTSLALVAYSGHRRRRSSRRWPSPSAPPRRPGGCGGPG